MLKSIYFISDFDIILGGGERPLGFLSISNAEVLWLQAKGSQREILKYLIAPTIWEPAPFGGGRTGWVQAAAPDNAP